MNKHKFNTISNNVSKSLLWQDMELEPSHIEILERKERFTLLKGKELEQAISKLLKFDINLLWERSFWGIGASESICAVASSQYAFLKRLKSNFKIS